MALEMLVCPHCRQRVLVGSTGLCPSCRKEIRPPTQEVPAPVAPSVQSVAIEEPLAARPAGLEQRPGVTIAPVVIAEEKKPEAAPPSDAQLPPWAVGRSQRLAAPKPADAREYKVQLFVASAVLSLLCFIGLVWTVGTIRDSLNAQFLAEGISKVFSMLAFVVAALQLVVGMVGGLAVLFRRGRRTASTAMIVLLAPPALFFVLPVPFVIWLLYLLQIPNVRAQFDTR